MKDNLLFEEEIVLEKVGRQSSLDFFLASPQFHFSRPTERMEQPTKRPTPGSCVPHSSINYLNLADLSLER